MIILQLVYLKLGSGVAPCRESVLIESSYLERERNVARCSTLHCVNGFGLDINRLRS